MTCLRRLAVLVLAAASAADAMKVLVTGAGGKTGKLVFEQLKSDKMTPASSTASVDVVGLCRSKKAVKTLKKVGAEVGRWVHSPHLASKRDAHASSAE